MEVEDHACLIFEKDEDQIAAVVPFLIEGLEHGERAFFLADASKQQKIIEILHERSIDARSYLEAEQLVMIGNCRGRTEEGASDPGQVTSLLNEALKSAGEKGCPAVRASLDMADICPLNEDASFLYIARLEEIISKSRCRAFCQYDRRRFPPSIIQSVLEVHPLVVMGREKEAFRNPQFLSPEALLMPELPELRLNRSMESLKMLNQREAIFQQNEECLRQSLKKSSTVLFAHDKDLRYCLKESEERLRLAADAMGLSIWDWDLIEDKITWSKQPNEHLGHVQGSFEQAHHSFLRMVHASDREQVNQAIERSLKDGVDCEAEFRLINADGEMKWISVNGKALFDDERRPVRMIGVERDITKQKAAYEALKESEERYRALFESSIDGILITAPDGRIHAANPAACRILGRTQDEIVIGGRSAIVDKNDSMLKPLLEKRSREGYARGEFAFVRRDGTNFPVDLTSSVYKDKNGDIRTSIIFRDISDRKAWEEKLIASEDKFSAAFQISPDPMVITCVESGIIIDINRSFEDITGFSGEELIGRSPLELNIWVNPHEREEIIRLILDRNEVLDYPVELRMKNGNIKDMLFSARFINISDKIYLLSQAHDITEMKKLEEDLKKRSENLEALVEERTDQLKKVERLAAIGETAAMIGHDLRNPLQAVYCMIYLAREQMNSARVLPADGQMGLDDILDSIEESADYMNRIVSDIQDFARNMRITPVRTDISFFIRDTLSTIKIPDNVHVIVGVDENVRELRIDPDKMKRIITNLVSNAINAMPDGGSLSISVSKKGDLAKISVKDTGTGIPEEILPKLFLPLFTTRSKGVGLGLSVCKRMVDAMEGIIAINSRVGQGTEAIIEIPVR